MNKLGEFNQSIEALKENFLPGEYKNFIHQSKISLPKIKNKSPAKLFMFRRERAQVKKSAEA